MKELLLKKKSAAKPANCVVFYIQIKDPGFLVFGHLFLKTQNLFFRFVFFALKHLM